MNCKLFFKTVLVFWTISQMLSSVSFVAPMPVDPSIVNNLRGNCLPKRQRTVFLTFTILSLTTLYKEN